ncbi:hypothetical protein CONCODRAFT_70121 [Conidiobolus coronatus NRRL 28638]|uniref:F-box domain-containing protein n=1 Tax=Conidiobolus coronatus (strain ATCC 28846 / CBS 209.66 / NRRL 28638) TaxID=796925 RepID=A0A137P7R3_CONC2|nr:hypothetical protein CONCODRAFT_70121 [Conidiobolus coronatus NRRL 28638]|eukprot:KXN71053.1 hypothetical protein CONCODRAFT_70121 [Conidiobolus coronatus NRRL 28638]
MNTFTVANWSSLPAEIITNIVDFVPKELKLNLRLVNKHCCRLVDRELFHFLKFDKPSIKQLRAIEKYSTIAQYVEFKKACDTLLNRFTDSFINVKEISWDLYKESFLLLLKLLNYNKKVEKITIDEKCSGEMYASDWEILSDYIGNLNLLSNLEIQSNFYNLSLFNDFKIMNSITSLCLHIYLKSVSKLPNLLASSKNLTKIDLFVKFDENTFHEETYNLIIEDFFQLPKIKHFNLKFNGLLKADLALDYYYSTIYNLIHNSKLNCLISFGLSFEMDIIGCNISEIHHLLPQAVYSSLKFENLSKLSLFKISSELMILIIDKCPNLKDLKLNSEFIVPDSMKSINLKPLYKLTKLEFVRFDNNVKNRILTAKNLFPSVVKIKFHKTSNGDDSIDIGLIQKLFPNITTLHLNINHFKFSDLLGIIDKEIKWEELCICQKISNRYSMTKVFRMLPILKILYLPYQNFCHYHRKFEEFEFNLVSLKNIDPNDLF